MTVRTHLVFAILTGVVGWSCFGCKQADEGDAAFRSEAKSSAQGELRILQAWSGDYPVDQLDKLPTGQGEVRVGYIGNSKTFTQMWQVFKPKVKIPEVNFREEIVLFSRNIEFYNRTSIQQVKLSDGVAEIIAMETRSARPIEKHVAMALAVVPRADVKFIKVGDKRRAVEAP